MLKECVSAGLKQREHVGPDVVCVGGCRWWWCVVGHVGFMFHSPLAPFFCFVWVALWIWCAPSPFMLLFLFNVISAGWMPEFYLTANCLLSSTRASTCSYDNHKSTHESWHMFIVWKPTSLYPAIIFASEHFRFVWWQYPRMSQSSDSILFKSYLIIIFLILNLKVALQRLKKMPFRCSFWQTCSRTRILFDLFPWLEEVRCQHVSSAAANQSMCSRPWNSRRISDSAAGRARAQRALSCS